MRLFGKINGVIDADDRAQWLTPPYGLPPQLPPIPTQVSDADDTGYRRQQPTYDNYRRMFGQNELFT